MAEWSKALRSGRSPLLWARVRIPLLTKFSPLPEKVEAIINYKPPSTIHDLRTFLGLINFYRIYLKVAAKTQAPLHELLKERKKDLEAQRNFAVSSVLQQFENDGWKPIVFYSKKLNDTQRRDSTYDKELLRIYLSVKHFKHLLEGNDFTIYTDYKPLTFAFRQKKKTKKIPLELQYISKFSTNIQHIQDNVVVDALSRIESVSTIDYDAIAEKQAHGKELQQLMQESSSLQFKPSTLPSGKTLWCDISTSKIRPYIPEEFRMKMFQQIHGFCHPGVKSTIKQITEKFIWPEMKKQVGKWAKTCMRCQRCKVNRHTKSKFGVYQIPDGLFSVVRADLIGPLPPSEGMKYCLTCIDRYSSWIKVVPLPAITAEIVGKTFYHNWICRFGVSA
ncbi:transposon Ty3-G Gag-Pol polyprotein [Nephila pilipes]|uniref:RNA-directed DNA polymerase n=1 Tax=Nephila pilipes TaxID=299642 RepID=A0A8X6PHE6_NEPPI|nr:transposon Ty3-G Gag-Pol polyprotein [Nephila pilipes]GFT73101.1 transposon Ty3-G Gag-Pol polyprotein [Nephila pilipes]